MSQGALHELYSSLYGLRMITLRRLQEILALVAQLWSTRNA